MDEFFKSELKAKEVRYLERLQKEVVSCIYCQPYDDGEPFWVIGKKTDLDDLLMNIGVPERSWDRLIQHLHCPECGNESFDRCSEVGVKTQFDIEVDAHMNDVYRLYGKEVKKFEEYIKNPFHDFIIKNLLTKYRVNCV